MLSCLALVVKTCLKLPASPSSQVSEAADGVVIEQVHNRAVRSTGQFRSRSDVRSMERWYYEAFVLRGTTVLRCFSRVRLIHRDAARLVSLAFVSCFSCESAALRISQLLLAFTVVYCVTQRFVL